MGFEIVGKLLILQYANLLYVNQVLLLLCLNDRPPSLSLFTALYQLFY